ncbi:MAG: hypothetical protein K2X57_13945 [Xanthobacteraceae bacterium]|nr:hypothetical protein [Xanthobacteraceae bacterium]
MATDDAIPRGFNYSKSIPLTRLKEQVIVFEARLRGEVDTGCRIIGRRTYMNRRHAGPKDERPLHALLHRSAGTLALIQWSASDA